MHRTPKNSVPPNASAGFEPVPGPVPLSEGLRQLLQRKTPANDRQTLVATAFARWAEAQSQLPNRATAWTSALRFVALVDGEVLVHADNASAATAVRYRRESLLDHLRQTGAEPCERLTVRVRPPT